MLKATNRLSCFKRCLSWNSLIVGWYFLVIIIWILYLLQLFYLSPQTTKSYIGQTGNDFESYQSRLIFLISMGQEASHSKLVERFLWSARHRGKYEGWILLLTDAPVNRYASLTRNLIVMNPKSHHFNTSFRDDMPYKRFKTFMIDYVDRDTRLNSIKLIYYLDVDNIVGNSLPQMFQDLEATYNIPGRQWLRALPRVWFFANKYKHLRYVWCECKKNVDLVLCFECSLYFGVSPSFFPLHST